MRVLESQQDRAVPGKGVELVQQRFEQHLALALRTKIERGCGVRQRQQLCQQRHLIVAGHRRCEQSPQLVELLLGSIVESEAGGALKLYDERIESAVLVVRQAEIAQP